MTLYKFCILLLLLYKHQWHKQAPSRSWLFQLICNKCIKCVNFLVIINYACKKKKCQHHVGYVSNSLMQDNMLISTVKVSFSWKSTISQLSLTIFSSFTENNGTIKLTLIVNLCFSKQTNYKLTKGFCLWKAGGCVSSSFNILSLGFSGSCAGGIKAEMLKQQNRLSDY